VPPASVVALPQKRGGADYENVLRIRGVRAGRWGTQPNGLKEFIAQGTALGSWSPASSASPEGAVPLPVLCCYYVAPSGLGGQSPVSPGFRSSASGTRSHFTLGYNCYARTGLGPLKNTAATAYAQRDVGGRLC
jgi:hypothetical protein